MRCLDFSHWLVITCSLLCLIPACNWLQSNQTEESTVTTPIQFVTPTPTVAQPGQVAAELLGGPPNLITSTLTQTSTEPTAILQSTPIVSEPVISTTITVIPEGGTGTGFYYYADDQRIDLTPSPDEIAVRFLISASDVQVMVQNTVAARTFTEQTEIPNPPVTLLRTTDSSANTVAAAQELSQLPGVLFANPVFIFPNGDRLILTDEFIVQFKEGVAQAQIDTLNSAYKVEIVSQLDWLPNSYVLRITPTTEKSVLELANLYHQNELVEWAEPNFVGKLKLDTPNVIDHLLTPNDPFLTQQWAHNNTGPGGWIADADIDTIEAWDINTGSNAIIIAVIDEGVDISHEDLDIIGGFDFTGYDPSTNPGIVDVHGTAVAGIAAAIGDNGLGIAGVCWNCRIMSIRIFYEAPTGGSIINPVWTANGINYAWRQGADILNNSWHWPPGADPLITRAIRAAKNNGREGRGAVVVFASGNDNNSTVNYPARLDDVIAVGASSPCDERKSPTSCDGETNWGSNFGPELDVVAPGVVISTTDIMGSGGYDSGNYAPRFNGTSSATPHVAGLAALILSVNPNLTASDVQSIIETTADDILSQGFDNETGHGRINAAKALGVAQLPSTRGPQIPPGAVVGACYRVLPGDTIFTLAAQFGLDPNYINQVNDLYPPNYVYPQQILFLPARPGNGYNAYMVKPGDTFQSIAEQCHIDAGVIAQVNGLDPNTPLRTDQVLRLPFPPFPSPARCSYQGSVYPPPQGQCNY